MNSFGSRSTLRVGKQEFEIYRINALEQHTAAPVSTIPALLASHSAGKPAAPRGQQSGKGRGHSCAGIVVGQEHSGAGDRLHAQPRPAAGFHRRARGG